MSLLDKIKQQIKDPTGSQTPVSGKIDTVRGLLRGKTGREISPGPGPRQSTLQEKVATQQAQTAQQQLGVRGRIQAEQLGQREADIEQRRAQQEAVFEEQARDIQAQVDRRTNALLNQLETGQKQLRSQKDLVDIEQLGFNLRLQNQQYVEQLQREGQAKRLDNMLEFKREIARTAMSDREELMRDQNAFEKAIAADDRQFAQELAEMDLDYAMQIADSNMRAASQRRIFTGAGEAVTGGLEAATASGIFNSKEDGAANPASKKDEEKDEGT